MHIPDGFLSVPVWAGMAAASAPGVAWAARKATESLDERRVPLLGVMGAFVFAAQMVNFPVGIGTSGHLVGGALLSMTLGPAAAAVVMTAIVAVQALVFQDGGLLAMGANIFNMALAGVAAGYLPYHSFGKRAPSLAIFAGGFLSVLVSAGLALAQLGISGQPLPGAALTVSVLLFVVAAAAEGAITLMAVRAIRGKNSAWVREPAESGPRIVWAVGLAAFALVTVGALMASSSPDVLESLVKQAGFARSSR